VAAPAIQRSAKQLPTKSRRTQTLA
jgi:hypothetical protein